MSRLSCRFVSRTWSIVFLIVAMGIASSGRSEDFSLYPDDHISIVGNTLAERMQHDGWLEATLHARLPSHQLVIRNLGYSGDEITLRLRSQDFGTPDDWMTKNATNVIFAFFGYNESMAGPEGLDQFKNDLDQFLKHTSGQKYNGKSAPRIVLFSPIAHEDIPSKHLPDGTANNVRLEVYTEAMRQVAEANQVKFVDLFHPFLEAIRVSTFEQSPLTINGIHLNDKGNLWLAEEIDRQLFGRPNPGKERLDKIRTAVMDKNFYWFNRYRTVDGFSIYGGRADLQFTNGQTNREVMQREMEVLDVMTANRDKVVWAAAQGRSIEADDSNLPPFIPVISNKPGSGPNGQHVFLSGREAIRRMKPGKGLKVELVASEAEIPDLINPVQMAFDTQGRLWVATWPTYPHWKPTEVMNDKLLILIDRDGDGAAETSKVFADGLHSITGFEFWNGGVLVAMAPDILFLKDTDGDDVADVRERILHGIDSADTHHTANSFVLDPGGALYFQEGTFHHTQTETPYGQVQRCANAGVFRYDPRRMKFDVYVTHGFANPHGHVFGRWAEEIIHDGTGSQPYDGALFSGRLPFPEKHPSPPQVYNQRTRPCPGTEILSSSHFPEDMQGDLLVGNVIGIQGILRYRLREDGASYGADEAEPIVVSDDPNFRPSDLEMGPDGAIYFTDWQNPIIGHMQHNLRDPNRDRAHGRVYRVSYADRPLAKPAKISGASIDELLELLKSDENRVRYRAKIELSNRDSKQVIDALSKWLDKLSPTAPELVHHQMEALWMHQHHDAPNRPLLDKMLSSADHRARAAATRVAWDWRDRLEQPLTIFAKMASDDHPRVRLEAVRAASYFDQPEAMEVAVIAASYPSDKYLDYVQQETRRVLEPRFKKALAEGKTVPMTTEAGRRFALKSMRLEQILKLPGDRMVFEELLLRGGLQDDVRLRAIAGLASEDKKPEIDILLGAIESIDAKEQIDDPSVVFDLVRLLANRPQEQLAAARSQVEKLALGAKQATIRQMAFVSLMLVDKSVEPAWNLGLKSLKSLRDVVSAAPLLSDASLRAELYPRIAPLLSKVPELLDQPGVNDQGSFARYIRIEIPGPATLTLAEVEVFSDSQNVARNGKATQSRTAHGGDASRAIDGNTSGTYGDGGQTHTPEGARNPWWELDLGQSYPVERITIYNRTNGDLGNRLNNYSLIVMDESRQVIFRSDKNPVPQTKATVELEGGGVAGVLRQAAMKALVSIRGQEANTFAAIAPFVADRSNRQAAIRALRQLPAATWPKEQAAALAKPVVDFIRSIPVADRTSPSVLEAMEFAEALTLSLEPDAAKAMRKELRELGVQVIRVGTVLERMSYDKETMAIQAGKPVEFLFENSDLMPHNLVIVRPGSLEEVGMLAEATAQDAQAAERQYVPQSDKILLASRLLQPRDTQRLSFQAPKEPGIYPYVCTYPGHWQRMYGALYVVPDLDAYLADPDRYLASIQLEVKDDLLKDRRPRTEWKYDELAASLSALEAGRSYGNGKQLFTVASCASCHKMDGVGQAVGPDLTKLADDYKPADILREMLDPSAKINEKYQTYAILTTDGKVVTGLILEENAKELKMIENPLAKAEPVTIQIEDIESRSKSPTSIMPKGLLDKLTRDEILDLVAYIVARGDQNHPYVQPQGHHHHEDHDHGDH